MTIPYHATTTLAEIRAQRPCEDGWQKLLRHLGKSKADDEPLPLLTVLESNGLEDALWCLCCPSLERLSRHYQAWCAEQVLPHFEAERPDDSRVRDQIAMLRRDDASDGERGATRAAARDAARDAVSAAARDAARGAARAATSAAACAAAWDATWGAARAAAWAATWGAAWAAQERQLRAMIATAETAADDSHTAEGRDMAGAADPDTLTF